MSRFTISPAAADDLDEILAFVARDGTSRAEIVAGRLRAAILRAAKHPLLGHAHPAIDDPALRVWVVAPYAVVYRHSTRPIEVVRILHGARDVGALLGTPLD
jgi:antitoxin ParD1/3/4/toxin ParE1/3/4